MTCKPYSHLAPDGTEVNVIVCRRGSRRTIAACGEPHCNRSHTKLCDHPVTRNGKAGTCDRPMCDGHGVAVGPNLDYCPAHARVANALPFNRKAYLLWCAYHWLCEEYDRQLPHHRNDGGDAVPDGPVARGHSDDYARRMRRKLGLHPAADPVERNAAKRLNHEAVAMELHAHGWLVGGRLRIHR